MINYRRLQWYAIAISVASIFYNGAEGALSIAFGSESDSRSLVFFGIQSGIEVASSIIVVWRFRKIAKPGEEASTSISDADLKIEKIGSWAIGLLLAALALGTEVTAIVGLALHLEPDTSNASLIISASALVIMILIWLPKRYLARALNSSTMQGEAVCSLSCIQITIVLFTGSLVFRLWHGGWWLDSATSLILGLMFARESWKMLSWVRDPNFTGGCCGDCQIRMPEDAELQEPYKDLCNCCTEKDNCLITVDDCDCKVGTRGKEVQCCVPAKVCCRTYDDEEARTLANESKPCADSCCSKEVAPKPPIKDTCQDACCTKKSAPKPVVEDACKDACCAKKEVPKKVVQDGCKDACCSTKGNTPKTGIKPPKDVSEVFEPYNDLCSCCSEDKNCLVVVEDCNCKLGMSGKEVQCCVPAKACCKTYTEGARPLALDTAPPINPCADGCCSVEASPEPAIKDSCKDACCSKDDEAQGVESVKEACCAVEDVTSVGSDEVAQCTVPVEVPVSSCGGACCKKD